MKIKAISICLLVVMISMSLGTLTSCINRDDTTGNSSGEITEINKDTSQELRIFNTDLKLTQDQVTSQIRADLLKQNDGYLDSDEIAVMITLEDAPLADDFIDKYSSVYDSVADYAGSAIGADKRNSLKTKQKAVISQLSKKGLIGEVKCTYDTLLNGFATTIEYGDLSKLENYNGIKDVIISDTYNLPQATTDGDASSIVNLVDVYPTGIFKSDSVKYTGKKTAVAILDSGFDCSHTVFDKELAEDEVLYSKEAIEKLLPSSRAAEYTADIDIEHVYVSSKIPFAYDYADKDINVYPFDSEHGTHVAGIIGGKDDVITGVAVDTQLVLMKVFPDLDDGGKTEDILLALEDALLLNVDCINMSLGSSCGFSREVDEEKINEVYDKLNASGISVLTAASNSYSSGYGGEQGNTNMVTNPDSGTVGSPSTYAACLSVASISGTKSKYMVGNGEQVIFFKESNDITGKENDFFKELGITEEVTKEYQYVTVPGTGGKTSYSSIDVNGKIALVRRGDNTFEDKARIAKNNGAVACIIYNNIDGDILMSMGKDDHIPTISISKDDGTVLASKKTGTLVLSGQKLAGPFMSDFSSWGPTPSLELKPEITAHGGNIKSSVPGGGYDDLSGTSMATPNLCGIVVLVRQYLKEKYPDKSWKEISVLTNQMLMSTATIALNEEGNPYSPRKQGAGLASLKKLVDTKAYLSVDGKDRTKLELFDDPKRTGVYEMEFNVVNISDETLTYDLSMVGMTESVSTSDSKHVSETPQILNGNKTYQVSGDGTLNGSTVTVNASGTAKIKVTYTLTDKEKNLLNELFPYGMYVEGFVKLQQTKSDAPVDLNIPFLAFYGDWTEAPMFDKTYYEVESEAHDNAIDDDDKLKADYVATTPYGSYFYNYIIPLGTYLYDIDTNKYDEIPASTDRIAVSNILGTIDGISVVYAGLLRGAKEMRFTIKDKVTGEVIWEHVDYNANKAYSYGGTPMPYYEQLRFKSYTNGLVNNAQYSFEMVGKLDYGEDGGAATNVRNSFGFDFVADDEAPVIKSVTYEKKYDRTLKKDRYYINMVVYDNQYVQSITPIIFTSNSSYTFLTENPIPVYSQKGVDNTVKFEITEYLNDIGTDALITSALAFSVDDYALNSNLYICQLPGTRGDFKFTKDGTMDGTDLIILSAHEGEVIDLTQYLATSDATVDADKDYLKHLSWSSSNQKVIEVEKGIIKCVAEGKATVTVREQMDLNQAVIIINVKPRETEAQLEATETSATPAVFASARRLNSKSILDDYNDASLKEIRLSNYDTLFAYSRAAQTSEIGKTGDKRYISASSVISMYPGEKIRLNFDVEPWYCKDNYEFTFSSNDTEKAIVNQNGEVTALKEGEVDISVRASNSYILDTVRVVVKNPFVIENRELIAYKGLGGNVVIPDDEGILYIGAFAFCLYETDNSFELDEEDYDANKIPASNTSVTSIVIPKGVEEIKKYAFYNCSSLKSITIPSTVKYIREYAFYGDKKLDTINVTKEDGTLVEGNKLSESKVEVIGANAFNNCKSLVTLDLSKILAIGANAFDGCTSLKSADLTKLRNTGKEAFRNCTSLESVVLDTATKLSYAMFAKSGLKEVDIYSKRTNIPEYCFARCDNLERVTIHNNILTVGVGAFSNCPKLTEVVFESSVDVIDEQAFYESTALETIKLPNCSTSIKSYAFFKCSALTTIELGKDTVLHDLEGFVFKDTNLTTFKVDADNEYYKVSADGYLVSKDGTTIVLSTMANTDGKDVTIGNEITKIGESAFAGSSIKTLTITNPNTVIGAFAFAGCDKLEEVTLPESAGNMTIGERAFASWVDGKTFMSKLTTVENLEYVKTIGKYAFATTSIKNATIGANAVLDEGVFLQSLIEELTIGANATLGEGCLQNCTSLKKVNMPEDGGVSFGKGCFANCSELTTIDLSKTNDTIADETFYKCTKLMKADLANVKTIGKYAFADCAGLSEVKVPQVVEIGEGAFSRYTQYSAAPCFESIELPESLTTIGDAAFLYNTKLKSVTIPSSVTKIGAFTFSYCTSLKEVTLPEGVTTIEQYAFVGCMELSKINLGNVTTIGECAFRFDEKLNNVDISNVVELGDGAFAESSFGTFVDDDGNPIINISDKTVNAEKLERIGDLAFQKTKLVAINAPVLKHIGMSAFEDASSLVSFTFTNDIEYVGSGAFYGCTSLISFNYENNGNLTSNGKINDYAYLDNGVLYTMLKSGSYELKAVPAASMTNKLVVMNGTVRIDDYAGNANKHVTEIVLPDGLKRIGQYAFYGYTALKRVEFKSVIAPVLEDSYNKDSSLTEKDPGYDLLHNQFDLFGYELYYYNFIDLLGKNKPIEIVLPRNKKLEGYDSLVYLVYFGKVGADTPVSDYVAMEKSLIEFYEYANQVAQLKNVTLVSEDIVNKALTAYNSITQDPTTYGYDKEEFDDLVACVQQAKATIRDIKFANSTSKVKGVQALIDDLPTVFDVRDLELITDVLTKMNELQASDRAILDTTKLDALRDSYNEYRNTVNEQVTPIKNVAENLGVAIAFMNALLLSAFAFIFKRGII